MREWSSEGDSIGDPTAHQLEGAFGHTDAAHAVMDAARTQPGLCQCEPTTLLSEKIRDGNPDVVETKFAMSLPIVVPEDEEIAHDREARGVHGNQHHRLLTVGWCVRIGATHDDGDLTAWIRCARDPPFATVQYVLVPFASDGELDVARVARGDIGFGHGETRPDTSLE